jgi:four helix bundle protein
MLPCERFAAWRESYQLTLETYRVTEALPKWELYGLTSQARRAAYSVVANVTEGSAKRGKREFRRYLNIAIGSLAELAVAIRLARDLGMLSEPCWAALDGRRRRAGYLIWKLYRSLGDRER